MANKSKILFIAEGVSLAHPTRLMQLAEEVDSTRFEIHFATPSQFFPFIKSEKSNFFFHEIHSVPTIEFNRRLYLAQFPYTLKELQESARGDLALIKQVGPDLIVSDFRLSLGATARSQKIPLVSVVQAHWHPNYQRPSMIPYVRPVQMFGRRFAETFSPVVQPLILRNWLKQIHSFQDWAAVPRSQSLYEFYCDADHLLFPDLPGYYKDSSFASNCEFIGPILWSGKNIPWPKEIPDFQSGERPLAYISMGSTGSQSVIPSVVKAAQAKGYEILISTAGGPTIPDLGSGVWQAPYVPAVLALQKAKLFVCNGGTANTYHALSLGVPVLGITSNLDQCLHMNVLRHQKVAEHLHCDQVNLHRVLQKIDGLGSLSELKTALRQTQEKIAFIRGRRDINLVIESQLQKKNSAVSDLDACTSLGR